MPAPVRIGLVAPSSNVTIETEMPRLLVPESIAGAYAESLVTRARKLAVGNPAEAEVQLGPIVDARQAANVDRIIAGWAQRPRGRDPRRPFQPTDRNGRCHAEDARVR
ncbi:aldehyde dehydrogenase family protein [Streptomyces sp. SID13031]|uniref:aldehyde dehydrogenase family protein n=1 Tax=Streptomyces sp. SID13031 TaxID=2706046 RepID=UPI0013C905C0|nr:aldehyde dehydrogenase family protein [Streptomyces sp. SID13031]NEA31331.1 aldehyde dehydrogenase family protein [Streptomyces sp. SID13031]